MKEKKRPTSNRNSIYHRNTYNLFEKSKYNSIHTVVDFCQKGFLMPFQFQLKG